MTWWCGCSSNAWRRGGGCCLRGGFAHTHTHTHTSIAKWARHGRMVYTLAGPRPSFKFYVCVWVRDSMHKEKRYQGVAHGRCRRFLQQCVCMYAVGSCSCLFGSGWGLCKFGGFVRRFIVNTCVWVCMYERRRDCFRWRSPEACQKVEANCLWNQIIQHLDKLCRGKVYLISKFLSVEDCLALQFNLNLVRKKYFENLL